MDELFRARPFKTRNADEFGISEVLSLFVSPKEGLSTPFDFENTIIKGRMGSGKTMYLRANHAYYLSELVPTLIHGGTDIILPVLIRLNDFQQLMKPDAIYRAIIIKIIEELASVYLHLEDMKELASIQSGLRHIPDNMLRANKISQTMKQLSLLGSKEYIDRISSEFGLKTGIKLKFFEASAEWKNANLSEIKSKPNPGIKDIEECYKNLLEDQEGKILLLIDEAGSLDRKFFKNTNEEQCFFEILMNQFRTASFIRTKIAVYPHSYSDMLTETRYGDAVLLEENVVTDEGYKGFRKRTLELVKNYINPEPHSKTNFIPEDIFVLSENDGLYGDAIEQLMYSSAGNMRRLVQLLDLVMIEAYQEKSCAQKITKDHAISAMKKHASNTALSLTEQDNDFLDNLISVCKARQTYKFQFPNVPLYKYTNRSSEYNLINVDELGTGRRATTYSFDYAYCVLKEIPTHRMKDSEKICQERSNGIGRWLNRVASINQELIDHASLPGKKEGQFDYIKDESGFIVSDGNEQFFFNKSGIIESDKNKAIMTGKRVRFYPTNLGETKMAVNIEIL